MTINNDGHNMSGKTFCTEENLKAYLKNKSAFTPEEQTQLKYCIDNFSDCWKIWNKVRWDAAMDSEGVQELKEYLGDQFIPYYDSSWGLAEEWYSEKRDTKESVEQFYKNTKQYIYNSLIFYNSGDRDDFHKFFTDLKKKYNIISVIDYGCGVGNDGLKMLEEGVKVVFSDFGSPTLDFLKWRLVHRGYSQENYKVVEVDNTVSEKISAEMFWSIDVIEHMLDPLEIFKFISNETRLAVYYTDSDEKDGGRHPFHFKINENLLANEFIKRGYELIEHPVLHIWLKS